MPALAEGFGTWYYGKENVHLEWGACEYCHNITTLLSYDTQRYLVALYVPLIPIGRYRVLRECPACTKHKAAKLAAWESAKAAARERALQTLRTPSDSRQAVDEAVGGVLAFHDAGTFDEIVPMLVERYPNDPDMAGLIGSGCHFFNRLEEACNALRVSLAGKEDPAVRRELGLVLIRMRRAGEAHEVLQPLLVEGHPENLQYWFLLAAACQADGDHRAALDLISDANRLYPETASDKASKSLKAVSEKHLASGKPVVPKILKTDTRRIRETSAPIARFAGPVVVLALAIAFAWWSYHAGQHHQVFLVNGLDRAYEVQWDNATLPLARNGVVPLDTAEGEHSVAAPGIGLDAHTIVIEANPFVRPFASPVFVVNPDQVAPVIRELVEYVDESDAGADSDYECRLYMGLFHTLKHVNYLFQPFPESVMGEEGARMARTRVALAQDWSQTTVYLTLTGEGRTDEARQYLLRRFELQPDNLDTLGLLKLALSEEEYLDALREKLAARPVHVDVHRVYQDAMRRSQPGHDVAAEYARYVAAEPEDASLKYLLARSRPRPDDETRALYRQACDAEPPCPHAYHALAMLHLSEGRAEEALALANRACELAPDRADFRANRRSALTAARSWEALLNDIERNTSGTAATMTELAAETIALAAMGKPASEIEQQCNRAYAVWQRDGLETEAIGVLSGILKAEVAYVQGDLESYRKHAAGGWHSFAAAVTGGNLDEAIAAVEASQEASAPQYLLVYLLAEMNRDTARAGEYLEKAIPLLRNGSLLQQHVAACLAGEAPCVPEDLVVFGEDSGDAAIELTALGQRFPECRDAVFARARILNFSPQFPSRFLHAVLDSGSLPAAREALAPETSTASEPQ